MRSLLIAICCLIAATARAEDKPSGIIGEDDRQPAGDAFPWPSIGKVQLSGFSWLGGCTGQLIAPDLVLTAAHCFSDFRTRKQVPLAAVNFLLGVKRDANLGHAKAKCVALFGPLPDRGNPVFAFMKGDAAVIRLTKSLVGAPLELASDKAMAPGAEISLAGYGEDRKFWPMVHASCRVTWNKGLLAGSDCDVVAGQSGGPILSKEDGKMKLAGIILANSPRDGTIIMPAARIREFLASSPCPG